MRRRMFVAVLLAVVLGCACLAYAATPDPAASPSAAATARPDKKISLTLFLLNEEERPVGDMSILIQKNLESEEAYEGVTNASGELVIPVFPVTSFIMATRDAENTVTGLAQISLYLGDETRILNHPQTDETMDANDVDDTGFARNVSGSPRANLAIDAVPVNKYEVQVANDAAGIGCLLQLAAGNELLLRGVATGTAAQMPPEPTIPPDATDMPDTPPSQAPPSSAPSASPTATQEPTAEPTQTPAATSQAPTPTPEPTQAPTPEPTPTPAPATPTPAPTPAPATSAPAPTPSEAPTTLPTYINMKLFLKSPSGEALSYYVATLNNVATATANENGESYFMNVSTQNTNTLTVRNPQGVQVGTCGLRFIEGTSTTLASVNSGGTYTINYAPGQQDVYVEVVVDTAGTDQSQITLSGASSSPMTPGTVATPTPAPATPAPTAAATEDTGNSDVIGEPAATAAPITGPTLSGYFSNESGVAIGGATIRLLNTDTKNLSSSVTNAEGAFGVSHVPPGNYYLTATSADGQSLGSVQFAAARGNRTRLKTGKDGALYLSEGDGDPTVYVDLRELSNGQVGMLYASKSPLAAPAVLNIPSEVPITSAIPSNDQLLVAEESELVMLEPTRPPAGDADPSAMILVLSLVGAGAAVAAILLVRRAHIK